MIRETHASVAVGAASRIKPRLSGLPRWASITLLSLLLAGCKIVVTVPEGGRVTSEDGFECRAGDTCVIEVTDTTFDSTFTAHAAPAYTFTRWRAKPMAFCGNQTAACRLVTAPIGDNQVLLDLLASDQEFYLEPVFVSYDVAWWRETLEEVDDGTFSSASRLYQIAPNPAQCDPGALTNAARMRALTAVNQIRALHNLPAVQYDDFYDMQVQETSLVQRANNYLNHFPDPGDACYSSAAADGAASSNISGGSGGLADPAEQIFGWTNDNFNVAALEEAGHRRWILAPGLGYVSYGQVAGFGALKVFGFGMPPAYSLPDELEFVAMPYRAYPWVLVSKGANPTPWSLSMVPMSGSAGHFDYFGDASVSVTDDESGAKLAVHSLHSDTKGFGLANFLSWMVDGWDYDRQYTVRISNIRLPGGNTRDLEYPVLVDRYHLFNVDHPLEANDARDRTTLKGRFDSAEDRDSYRLRLLGDMQVAGSSEFSNQGFFVLVYDSNKRLVKASDEAYSMNFPQGQYTVVVSPCDEDGLCYQGTRQYSVTFR
jgi:hypothetical protein